MGKRVRIKDLQGEAVRVKPYKVVDETGNFAHVNPSTPTENIGDGQHTIFKSTEEFIKEFDTYMIDIVNNGFEKLPTKLDFAITKGISPSTVQREYNKLTENEKKEWQSALSDVITAGVNAGKYNTTMSIFALKNWCNWADKQESKVEKTEKKLVSRSEAKEQLQKYSDSLKLAK